MCVVAYRGDCDVGVFLLNALLEGFVVAELVVEADDVVLGEAGFAFKLVFQVIRANIDILEKLLVNK